MIIGSQPRRNLALVTAIALLSLLPATSALPQDMQNSFVEFNNGQSTTTYDLRTVEVIQPGKFVIVRTVIDDPDVMRFRLKLLATLQSHCARQEGSYPAPAEVFTLGPPDMPVEEIEVELLSPAAGSYKIASWRLPYTKTMVGKGAGFASFRCINPPNHTQEYRESSNVILNGIRNKVLYDCNRGLSGDFFGGEDEKDYRKAWVVPYGKVTWTQNTMRGFARRSRRDPLRGVIEVLK